MLLKQYPSRHPGKWEFIQRILLQIAKALTVPNSSLSSFVFAFTLAGIKAFSEPDYYH